MAITDDCHRSHAIPLTQRTRQRHEILSLDVEVNLHILGHVHRAEFACPGHESRAEARLARRLQVPGWTETCAYCGGSVKVIACIEEQDVIDRTLAHLHKKEQADPALPLLTPPSRAPPETLARFPGQDSGPTALHHQGRQ